MRLEDVVITPQLSAPSKRLPDFQNEVETFYSLARVMRNAPGELIDMLLQAGVDLCRAGTAGLSLLEITAQGEEIFRWTNLAGTLKKFVGGSMPRHFSPCGVCLDRNSPQLLGRPGRYFEYLNDAVDVPIVEALIIPIYIGDRSPGTLWILSHDESVHFDSEDVRIMTGLADFTASALGLLGALEYESQAREQAQMEVSEGRVLAGRLRRSQSTLEDIVQARTSELRELSARLVTSQDEERRRIARDLHDSTGQKVAALAIDLAMAQKEVSSLPTGVGRLAECLSLAMEVSDEIRTLSYLLHPPMLDELGLISAVQFYVEGINKRQTLEVTLEVASTPGRLRNDVEIALFRVVQAALSNVHLHSGSKRATVRFAQDSERLIVEIIDPGTGFRPEALKKGTSMQIGGVGLLGMKERLHLIGGRLEIETGSHGTVLRSVVPLSSSIASSATPSAASTAAARYAS